jgi:hypothetical protein
MFSTIPFRARVYSTAAKLWVKENGGPSTQVGTKGCVNVDDFLEKVKLKLNTHSLLTIHESKACDPLRPGLKLKDLFTALKTNSDESPLFVKVVPPSHHSEIKKTIFVRDTDDDEYKKFLVENRADVDKVMKDSKGLIHLSQPGAVIIGYDELIDGEKYQMYEYKEPFSRWKQNEANAMEEETKRAFIRYFEETLGVKCVDLHLYTDIMDAKNPRKKLQEWDAIIYAEDSLYLLEAKNSMVPGTIQILRNRVENFPLTVESSAQKDDLIPYMNGMIVGVACGIYFPEQVLIEARKNGLICIYPSGKRYHVDKEPPTDFIIER